MVKGNTKYRKHLGTSALPSAHRVPTLNHDPNILATGGRPEVSCYSKLSPLDPLSRNINFELDASCCLCYLLECRKCQLMGSVVLMFNHVHSEAMKTSLREKG